MNDNKTTVAVTLNQSNMLKALKQSFTHSHTFIGELMQNARRANATSVKFLFHEKNATLTVIDDGCGIDSLEKLLAIGESGWNESVVANEHPFGIGFLSALYACKRISLVSKGGKFNMDTDKILSMEEFSITPMNEAYPGTSITLVGVSIDTGKLVSTLEKLSKGFPIPVELNGHVFERTHAVDSVMSQFTDTTVGKVWIKSLHNLNLPAHCLDSLEVYLQGLPIYKSGYASISAPNVVHLDSSKFKARLPDRDKLIDEPDVIYEVKQVLREEIATAFIHLKKTHKDNPLFLVGYYELLKEWSLIHLLNDIKAIPTGCLYTFTDYPNCYEENFGYFLSPISTALTQEEVVKRGVVNFYEDIDDEGALIHTFAMKRDYWVYKDNLDKGHWIHHDLIILEEPDVELQNERFSAFFDGDYIYKTVKFCDAYIITINGQSEIIASHSVYLGDGREIIVPKNDKTAQVLTQASYFSDGNDNYQEDGYLNESTRFVNFVIANQCDNPVDAIRQLLPDSFHCKLVNNKAFVLFVDQDGKLSITGELPPEPVLDIAA